MKITVNHAHLDRAIEARGKIATANCCVMAQALREALGEDVSCCANIVTGSTGMRGRYDSTGRHLEDLFDEHEYNQIREELPALVDFQIMFKP